MTTTELTSEIVLHRAEELLANVERQTLVSPARFVDGLLDLYNSTDCTSARQLIGEALDATSRLPVLRPGDVRSHLAVIVAELFFATAPLARPSP